MAMKYKILIGIAVVVFFAMLAGAAYWSAQWAVDMQSGGARWDLAESVLKSQVPKKVDELTTLVDVEFEKPNFTYFFEVDTEQLQARIPMDQWHQEMETAMAERQCGGKDPNLNVLLAEGVIHYFYRDKSGTTFAEYHLDKSKCPK